MLKTIKSIPTNKIIFWVLGFLALVWFLLRTGTNPKRLTYPCQQAVFPLASAFLISFMAAVTGIIVFHRVISKSILLILISFVALFNISSVKLETAATVVGDLPVWTVLDPVSKIFVMDTVYATGGSLATGNSIVPDESLDDPTMDTLFKICSGNGLHLYKNNEHPDGIVGKNDIVIIKGNFQWSYRLVTNTDRIKGLIRLILAHPAGFKGEILVCDNTQTVGSILDYNKNNSDDLAQSILDVVNTFKSKGYPVSIYEWKKIRSIPVKEYSSNDTRDGYVFQQDKVTYPKFKTPGNAYISLRYGIWNPDLSTYDLSRLTIINFPVLKAHGMAGATIGIKNWVGVSTTAFTDSLYGNYNDMHYKYFWGEYALVARIMAVIPPKLTIVDASYTAVTNNTSQPPINTIVQTNKMLVSCDPVAVSWYSAKYILTPIATYPLRTNPDYLAGDPERNYGLILRKWTKFLIDSAHFAYTLDSAKISVYNSLPRLTVQLASLSFDIEACSSKIPVTSNLQWAAVSSATTWLSVSPASGNNNGEIIISATLNTGAERKGSVIVTCNGITRTIEVTQKAMPVLDIIPSTLYFEAEASLTSCIISSNVSWSISSEAKWLEVDPIAGSNNGNITISVSSNPTAVERKAIINVSASSIDVQTLTLIQAGINTTNLSEKQLGRKIGPNPVLDKIHIQLSPEDIPSTIGIYSIKGEQLFLIQTATITSEIDMSYLESGIYILKIRSPMKITQEKIFKK